MSSRRLFTRPRFWLLATGVATVISVACNSTSILSADVADSGVDTCQGSDLVACPCANGNAGTRLCNQTTCSCTDDGGGGGGGDSGAPVEAGPDAATPDPLYASCAKAGSFGAPCNKLNALDPLECTDPNFLFCFSNGKNAWCTTACGADAGGFAACLVEAPDAGVDAAGDAAADAEGGADDAATGAADDAAVVDASADADAGDGAVDAEAGAMGLGCVPTSCSSAGYCN